ncbi:MAG: anaerobic ribonucleoside-triphosphate reductase activating protein [Clostridia bacterium]|nr:anaerobic ribonucleoside-triphosphate reductase activating protein [Clostridia bacterium]
MYIAGYIKNSFVDYPGKIACSIFTVGCNMRCWYCHNSHLFEKAKIKITEEEIFDFLKQRVGQLDGVVVSGGEPTLQPDLLNFLAKVKSLGYAVKLDTNGTNFDVLLSAIEQNLVDYVAMDIKAPLQKYSQITGTNNDMESINESIDLLLENRVDYEFRTTFSPDLTLEDVEEICKRIKGAKTYSIQKYNTVEYNKINMIPRPKEDHIKAGEIAKKYVEKVNVKGI